MKTMSDMDSSSELNEPKFLWRNGSGYHPLTAADAEKADAGGGRVGTLIYTGAGLRMTVLLISVGAFGFFLMSSLVGALLPVEMKKLGASNALIAVFITSIPYVLNMIITPVVSFRSDRLRSALGRRMPYVLYSAPFVSLFLILIGWAPIVCKSVAFSERVSLLLLGVLSIGYQIFFLIVGSIIYYLFPDVIPEKFIGRFMALFQVIGSLVGFLFPRYLLPLGENYFHWLFTGVALFYLVTIFFMGKTVREGAYPASDSDEEFSLCKMVRSYFRECYSIPFYYGFFIMIALSDVSTICRAMFNFLYAQESLGLSYQEYGNVMGWGGVIGLVLSLPVGFLVDRFHALRVYAAGLFLVVVVNIVSFFYVNDFVTFYISSLLLSVVYTIQGAATLPCFVAILPKEYYGQFSSANALLRAAFMALCGMGGGILFDLLDDYQYIYAWDFFFTIGALISFFILYRGWRRRGGPDHYQPPLPASVSKADS